MPDDPIPLRPSLDEAVVDLHRDRLLGLVTGGGLRPTGPPTIVGYAVEHPLGEGGMGEIWSGRDPRGHPVAIKVMKPTIAAEPSARGRFLREARALADLDHEGIVRILDVGETEDERLYLVMERLHGSTLAQEITRRAPIRWEEARPLLDQMVAALAEAHTHGIVHRDLKPSNVMLVDGPAGRSCRVIDFGLARHRPTTDDASSHTMTGHVLGTPAYMSPEQLKGEPADARSDIYALGCVAYEMLTGRKPFGIGRPEELFYRHLVQPVPPPDELRVSEAIRPAVEAILQRTLRKLPANRFQSMRELSDALRNAELDGRPVSVPIEPWTEPDPQRPEAVAARPAAPRWLLLVGAGVIAGWGLARVELPTSPIALSRVHSVPEMQVPSEIAAPRPAVTSVAAGLAFSCAASERHEIRCWGSDSRGRLGRGSDGSNLGDNDFPSDAPPLLLPPSRPVAEVVTDGDSRHACVRFSDGGVRCWGHNVDGQLGLGSRTVWGDEPHETVANLEDLPLPAAARVVTGRRTTCMIDEDGRAWCWGRGDEGVRGDGTTETIGEDEPLDASTLRAVALGPRHVRDLDLGRNHACALLDDASVRCWGDGARGQLGVAGWRARIGDGIGDGRGHGRRPDTPALAVAGLDDVKVKDVAAGGDRTCVVTEAGTVRCWGDDSDGALGYAPETVAGCDDPEACIVDVAGPDLEFGGATIERVALSLDHACAIDDTGGVHCWGLQIWGRVGDGRARPGPASELDMTAVAVLPIRIDLGDIDGDGQRDRALTLAMGDQHTCALVHTGGMRCWGYGSNGALGYASTDTVGDNETPAEYYARIGVADVPVF